jgi:formylmethanofuran dehydrogenase subunit C
MNNILDGLRGRSVEVYMDDVVIHSKEDKEHDILLEKVLERFKRYGLRINQGKIQYKQE